ncbi:hypothetical protein E2562_036257 [Oryza meyeriana var. granulata]|uniref:Retrotransposon gag domain-containing protein n=1 Tax=Oryza meyeriana var. granulata TaxID=110450 RepID=A0A6G1CAW1_9ORYZ|nr:hypothetical protein E2562_036257 [Oryza meyeriana var. granulata]
MQTIANLYAFGSQATQERQAAQARPAVQANRGPSNYGDFMRTKLPVCAKPEEALQAKDWIHMTVKKLDPIRARDEDKVCFAMGQLDGPASDWWDAYKASQDEEAKEPYWVEFIVAFRENFVPTAIMKMKKDGFRSLRRDNMSVQVYLNKFAQLAHYAPKDIPNEQEKIDKFLRVLNYTLRAPLIIQDHANFQSMVNKAPKSEEDNRKVEANINGRWKPTGSQLEHLPHLQLTPRP